MADITVIGSNMFELTTFIDEMPALGATVEALEFTSGFGGKGANQAIAAAKLGADVNFITMLGNDDFGRQQLANYTANGIKTTGIFTGTTGSGVAPIFVDAASNNRILIVKGANNELTPAVLDAHLELIKGSKLIVLQQEISQATNYHAIELANSFNIPVLLNPAPADKNFDHSYLPKVTFYAPNETELSVVADLPTTTLAEIKLAARKVIGLGVPNLIVTLGSKGCLWLTAETEELITGLKVDAVDTTGAGDAFIGSFAYYYTSGMDILTALKQANYYAAQTVTKRGTQTSYPSLTEVLG